MELSSGAAKTTARRGLGGLAAVLALVLLSAAGIFAFWYLPRRRDAEIAAWSRDLGIRADLRREALTRFFEDGLAGAATVAGYPSNLRALGVEGAAAGPEPLRPHLAELFAEFARTHSDLGVALWDAAASPVVTTPDTARDDGCADAAREVLASGAPALGIHRHGDAGPVLTFSAPVRSPDGVLRGAVTILEDPRRWLYPFLARPFSGSDTGEAALVARDGDDALLLSPLRDQPDAALRFRRPLGRLGFAARAGFEGSEAVAAYTDHRGVRVLATGRRLPPSLWVLATKVDEAEVLKGVRADARRSAAALAAFLLGATALVWGLAQRRERLQQAALAQSEARFGALLEEAEDAIFLLDEAGRILDANRRAEQMYGTGRAELLTRSAADLRAPAEREGAAAAMEKLVRDGRNLVTTVHRRADGSTFPVEIRSRRIALGSAAFLVAIVRDITERRRQEDAIRHSEERYRALFDGMLNGFAYCEMLREDGRPSDFIYLAVNRAFGELTGLADVVGRRVSEVIPGLSETNPDILEAYGRVAETGKPETFESYVPALGRWFSVSAYSPRKGHFVSVFENVTERKDAEASLHEAQAHLAQSQKMEAVGRLAGGVAHDFNNLLTVIRGYAELLAPSLDSDPNSREEIAEILRAAERAATLTGQLLAFSRRQTLEMHPLDLRAAVADTEKMLRRLIGEDIRLEVALPPALGRVNADRGQIEQVLLNLAVNARDAMPDGGPLRIALFETVVEKPLAAADGPIPPGRYVVLAVADKGTGMDSETRAHAFEPFYTTKEKGKGTGLGLSTVFGIVKQSGGHIRLTSAPGAGATFELYFPRAGDEDGEEAPVRAGERGGTETILIAEDEAGVRDLAARFLARWGYRILTAESGPAALARAGTETRPIDLLLTDLVMPGMSGAALARSLAAKRPGLKILFMSGYPHDVLAESPSPPPPLLRKPFTEADLVRQVREALDGPPSVFASPPGDPGRDDAPG